MIKQFFHKRFGPKLRYLTFKMHPRILVAAIAVFAIATFYLAMTINGLPATKDVLNAVKMQDAVCTALFAIAMSFAAFVLGKKYTFQNNQLIIKGFLLTHTLEMSGIESLERAERWGFVWFRLHCGGRSFLIPPPEKPEEFADNIEKGMKGEEFEGSYSKYGPRWFI